ncbi:MAG: hypothetical protein N2506_03725 [Dehalococcoidales bacterium]|nr:hypothetical protein [Dehalococcoidales bacterium]
MKRLLEVVLKAAGIAAIVLLLVPGIFPAPVHAQGGVAISGSFYHHHFMMLPGETFTTPDVYVIIFNHYEEEIRVRMTTIAPEGVEVRLAEVEFNIPPGGSHTLDVTVSVGADAVPGEYEISVSADVLPAVGSGIAVVGAAQQTAKLTVMGEAGSVRITTVLHDGTVFPCDMHIYRILEGNLSPAGYSSSGKFESRLVPGNYMVQAFYKDYEVAKENFTLHAGEDKEITLVAQTVFILGFGISPRYSVETKRIVFANLVYTIKNIYMEIPDPKLNLRVNLNGAPLEEATIFQAPLLNVGDTSGSFSYIPEAGWQAGEYSLRLQLYSGDILYAVSDEKTLTVAGAVPSVMRFNLWWLIAVVVLVFLILLLFLWRRRKKKAEKKRPRGKPRPPAPQKKTEEEKEAAEEEAEEEAEERPAAEEKTREKTAAEAGTEKAPEEATSPPEKPAGEGGKTEAGVGKDGTTGDGKPATDLPPSAAGKSQQ